MLPLSQQMLQRFGKADGIPECGCGSRKMVMRCAGKQAIHTGRYYLKCPEDLNHPGSFIWCDEYIGGMGARSSLDERGTTLRLGKDVANVLVGSASAARRDHFCTVNAKGDASNIFLIGFSAVMLVVVGIFLGKII